MLTKIDEEKNMLDKYYLDAEEGDLIKTWFGELLYLHTETDGKLYGYPLPNGQLDSRHSISYNFDFDKNDFTLVTKKGK
jgi:hypothetical protein